MKLSVIIPAYNEEKRIAETLRAVDAYLKKQSYDYEIVVVVNGSNDHTYEIVRQLESSSITKAKAVNLKIGGKGNAVKEGILHYANGDIVMFMDADNASPISEIAKFLPYFQEGFDCVIGSREVDPSLLKIQQTLKRRILGKLSHELIRFLLLPGIYDTQLGFKAFTSACAKDVFTFVNTLDWGFDMEVLTVARVRGYKIKEVGVLWEEHGGSHLPMRAYLESLKDLCVIKYRKMIGAYAR